MLPRSFAGLCRAPGPVPTAIPGRCPGTPSENRGPAVKLDLAREPRTSPLRRELEALGWVQDLEAVRKSSRTWSKNYGPNYSGQEFADFAHDLPDLVQELTALVRELYAVAARA